MHGEEEEDSTDGEKQKSSTPKATPRRLSSDLAVATAALRDATAQVRVQLFDGQSRRTLV